MDPSLPGRAAREIVRLGGGHDEPGHNEPMTETTTEQRTATVAFTGSRAELTGIILRGYALMLPTLGLYRFWQATSKRRFYWQNTVIDGEPLEYTGRASQLLLGFLFALAVFVPVYMALFYLSMQETDYLLAGYLGLGALLWFFMGYGIYRARDFRLSRTLWRGIRFNLHGSAWGYALRRFLWSVVVFATVGLAYPWMASSLWRYRWKHTWYGDRRFEIAGNWRTVALPFYVAFFCNIGVFTAALVVMTGLKDAIAVGRFQFPGPISSLVLLIAIAFLLLTLAYYRAHVASRMLSTVALGEAKLRVDLPTWTLFFQYVGYGLAIVAVVVVLALVALLAIGGIIVASGVGSAVQGADGLAMAFQSGTLNVVLLIGAYLVVLGTFGLLSEVIIGFGWWRLLARSARIENPQSIATVKASTEDTSLVGQGIADALNVGTY